LYFGWRRWCGERETGEGVREAEKIEAGEGVREAEKIEAGERVKEAESTAAWQGSESG
jgi:hypothetical protein